MLYLGSWIRRCFGLGKLLNLFVSSKSKLWLSNIKFYQTNFMWSFSHYLSWRVWYCLCVWVQPVWPTWNWGWLAFIVSSDGENTFLMSNWYSSWRQTLSHSTSLWNYIWNWKQRVKWTRCWILKGYQCILRN